jgi:hypothetical protein
MTSNQIIILSLLLLILLVILYDIFNKNTENFDNIPSNPKIAIITSIYGNYDNIKDQPILEADKVDWYCFTDNKNMKSNQWNIITEPYHLKTQKYDCKNWYDNIKDDKTYNMMCAKYYKIKYHEIDILQKYDYIIWIDGSILLREKFIVNVINNIINNNYELINFKHSKRTNIKDELQESLNSKKYTNQNITQQYDNYIKSGFTDNIGLFENTIIIRKPNNRTNKIFDLWWIENLKQSFQDQISYPYVLWGLNEKPDYIIPLNVFDNEEYSYVNYDLIKNHLI